MSDPRSVVLVTVDSLRADYCGFMGSDRGLTPNLDRHAEAGLVFTNAVTPGPSTLDALPGIFTGEDLVASGADEGVRERLNHHLRARETLPERFVEMGYETAAFTANPWTSRQFGFDRGFDHFEDFLDETGEGRTDDGEGETVDGLLPLPIRLLRRWGGESSMFQAWGSFYDDVLAWTEQAEGPYFLWLFLVDVHMPYLPVPGARSQPRPLTYGANLWLYLTGHESGLLERAARGPLVRAYEDTIRYTDDLFGSFVADLEADDPAIVFHADHGEAFGEAGFYAFHELTAQHTRELRATDGIDHPTLWDLLSPAAVANVPMTYPASEMDGRLVAGMMAPEIDASATYPPDLAEAVRERVPDYEPGLSWEEYHGDVDRLTADLEPLVRARRDLQQWLMETVDDWRLFFTVFTAPDRLQHLCWDEETLLSHYGLIDVCTCVGHQI